MARWQNSSIVREAGLCHPHLTSAGSSSGVARGHRRKHCIRRGSLEACRDAVASFKAARRHATAQGFQARGGLSEGSVSAREGGANMMPSKPRRQGARRCEVQVRRGTMQVGHVRRPKLATRKHYRHAAKHPDSCRPQHHAQRRMPAYLQMAVCEARIGASQKKQQPRNVSVDEEQQAVKENPLLGEQALKECSNKYRCAQRHSKCRWAGSKARLPTQTSLSDLQGGPRHCSKRGSNACLSKRW